MSAISDFSTTNPASSTDDAFNTLSSAEFLQIIFTELQNQDPLEPQDSQAMLNQLSSLRSIESDTKMVDSLQSLVSCCRDHAGQSTHRGHGHFGLADFRRPGSEPLWWKPNVLRPGR